MKSNLIVSMLLEEQTDGYLAVVLTPRSRNELLRLVPAKHEDVIAHHMTIAFKPGDDILKKYKPLVGKKIKLVVLGAASDEKGQAVLVNGPSENPHPHITISCAPGVEAKYSNELLSRGWRRTKPFNVYGQVQFVPLDDDPASKA